MRHWFPSVAALAVALGALTPAAAGSHGATSPSIAFNSFPSTLASWPPVSWQRPTAAAGWNPSRSAWRVVSSPADRWPVRSPSKRAFPFRVLRSDGEVAETGATLWRRLRASARGTSSFPAASRTGFTRVVVELKHGRTANVDRLLRKYGARVEAQSGGLVQAWLPARVTARLGRDPAVARVRPPAQFTPLGVPGEGVASTNAAAWQVVGLTGSGVKVAIIDGGFAGLADRQASGDIPTSVTTVDYCGGKFYGPENHGTAVAEIVAEEAPGAQLILICINTDVTLAVAEAYAKGNGAQIVNLSAGFFNTWRGDGNGPPGTPDGVVADARANNILWVNAAGNEAMSHWAGAFVSADGDAFTEFTPGDETNAITIPPNEVVCGFLRWDNWPRPNDDYDLLLYDFQIRDFVARSVGDQVAGQLPPTEEFCVQNISGATRQAGFVIARYRGGTPANFDLFVRGSPYGLGLEHATASRSLAEPAASANVLTAGATCWQSNVLEDYSSQGPTIDNRLKPDLTAPDSVSGATYGAFSACGRSGFSGTSASAPYTAGAAALVKQRYPTMSAADLQKYLVDHATDLGPPGPDMAYGAGKLALPAIPPASVRAVAAKGRYGRVVRLRFGVSGAEWETRENIDVYRGTTQIRSFDIPFQLSSNAQVVAWRAPKKPTNKKARPVFRFCVQAWDHANQASVRSCAPISVTGT